MLRNFNVIPLGRGEITVCMDTKAWYWALWVGAGHYSVMGTENALPVSGGLGTEATFPLDSVEGVFPIL